MFTSTFDLFKPGIGPSSSHTMGPMTAAARFLPALAPHLPPFAEQRLARLTVTLHASLALTGRGHATDRAVLLGLMGFIPATMDPDDGDAALAALAATHLLPIPHASLSPHGPATPHLPGEWEGGREGADVSRSDHAIPFDPATDIIWAGNSRLAPHPNALTFTAWDAAGATLLSRTYFSIGGGFVRTEAEMLRNDPAPCDALPPPYPYRSGADLLDRAAESRLSIAAIMRANEATLRPAQDIDAALDRLLDAMDACIDRGLRMDGILPGGLQVRRRARQMRDSIRDRAERATGDPLAAMDWVNLWALAVNEENAAGGRVVTAPTNGAAGIIPAVLRYYTRLCQSCAAGRRDFLLTAAAIGSLYKANASISGAEVGCQGEVGVACSMAAAGLAAALGATPAQVENAAEIGMEHNLGLTCDPIGGLVQIPCIERNAMGAIKAIDAARLALHGDGTHHVSLDKVIATMKRTGADMNDIYKETSLGGLATGLPVNRVEC